MPSQVQLNGESNGLSVESLNLDVNGTQPGGLVTPEIVEQVCHRSLILKRMLKR